MPNNENQPDFTACTDCHLQNLTRGHFRGGGSWAEYKTSGRCQDCQDGFWASQQGDPEEDEERDIPNNDYEEE